MKRIHELKNLYQWAWNRNTNKLVSLFCTLLIIQIILKNVSMQKAAKPVFQLQRAHLQAVPSVLQPQIRKRGGPFSEETMFEYPIVILTQAIPQVTYQGPEVNPIQVNLAAIHLNVLPGRKDHSYGLRSPNIPCTIRPTTQNQSPLTALEEMTICNHLIRSEYQRLRKSQ